MTPRPTSCFAVSLGLLAAAAVATVAAPPCCVAALYAVTDAGSVFESPSDGVTWAEKGAIPEPDVVSLSPGLTAGTLFALGRTGSLYRSTNAGAA